MTSAKFEYSLLIGQGLNHRSLMLEMSHVRSALCTLKITSSDETPNLKKYPLTNPKKNRNCLSENLFDSTTILSSLWVVVKMHFRLQ